MPQCAEVPDSKECWLSWDTSSVMHSCVWVQKPTFAVAHSALWVSSREPSRGFEDSKKWGNVTKKIKISPATHHHGSSHWDSPSGVHLRKPIRAENAHLLSTSLKLFSSIRLNSDCWITAAVEVNADTKTDVLMPSNLGVQRSRWPTDSRLGIWLRIAGLLYRFQLKSWACLIMGRWSANLQGLGRCWCPKTSFQMLVFDDSGEAGQGQKCRSWKP